MLKKIKKDCKDQNGEVMLEASMILVLILLLLMAMLSLSFMFYQEAMMVSVANEIAADIAKNYKFTETDVGENTITLDEDYPVGMFRMTFGKSKIEKSHIERAEAYADWRVTAATLGIVSDDIDVECEIKSSGIGRAYTTVTVSQKTDFFLSSILDLMEITDENTMFSATAYAECNDPMAYTSMVNFTEYGSNLMSKHGFGAIGRLYGSIKEFIEELMG